MKRFIALIVLVALLFITGCSKKEEGIAELLPQNTLFLFKLNSLETLAKHFSITGDSVFGNKIDIGEKLNKIVGFNPLNIADLKTVGIDTGKDIGVALISMSLDKMKFGPPQFSGIVLIPVTNSTKVEKKIEELLAKHAPEVKLPKEKDIVSLNTGEKDKNIHYMIKNNYLLITLAHKCDSKVILKSIGESSLYNSESFKKIKANIDTNKALFFYANFKEFFGSNSTFFEQLKKKSKNRGGFGGLNFLLAYKASGLAINFESPDFIIEGFAEILEDSKVLNMIKSVKYNKKSILGIKDKPALLLSYAMNFQEYLNLFLDGFPHKKSEMFKAQLEMIKTKTGIDLEKELLENIAGNLNLGFFDGASINMTNYNAVLTINMKDESVMKNLIEKAINLIPTQERSMIKKEKVEDIESYVLTAPMMQLCAGIKDNNLIIATGRSIYKEALKGSISSGFTSKLKESKLVNTFKGDTGIFYMDISEMLKVYKNFSELTTKIFGHKKKEQIPKIVETIGKIKYILVSSKVNNNFYTSQFVLKTNFSEPFFLEIQKIIKSFHPEK